MLRDVGNGGNENGSVWCKQRWGVNWQVMPHTLTEVLTARGDARLRRDDDHAKKSTWRPYTPRGRGDPAGAFQDRGGG